MFEPPLERLDHVCAFAKKDHQKRIGECIYVDWQLAHQFDPMAQAIEKPSGPMDCGPAGGIEDLVE